MSHLFCSTSDHNVLYTEGNSCQKDSSLRQERRQAYITCLHCETRYADIILDIDELVNPVTVYAITVTGYPISRGIAVKNKSMLSSNGLEGLLHLQEGYLLALGVVQKFMLLLSNLMNIQSVLLHRQLY